MIRALQNLDTARFNRACTAIGLAVLVLTQTARYIEQARRGILQGQDFAQYYMGGLIALHGQWDSLYPIPHPGALTNAGFSDSSDLHADYRALANAQGIGDFSMRFFQPPPAALMFAPLALLPYRESHIVWTILLTLAAWGVAICAGEMHATASGKRTRWIGVLILLICCSPQAHRWIRVGNLSVVIAWLIGITVHEIIRRDGPRAAASFVVGALLKYALLVLSPLLIAARRWRTLAWSIVFSVLFIAISLLVMGVGPYRVFATEIAPTLSRTSLIAENQALYRFLLEMNGATREDAMPRPAEIAFRIAQVGSFAILLLMIFLKVRNQPPLLMAAALALVSWLLIFSPIFWEHYHAYLAPFWGWLVYEGSKSRGKRVAAIAAIALAYVPSSLIASRLHMERLPEPLLSHLLWSAVIMFAMAVTALAQALPQRAGADEH